VIDTLDNSTGELTLVSDIDGAVGTTDSVVVNFTYDVIDALKDNVNITSGTASSLGKSRDIDLTETSASSSELQETVGLVTADDLATVEVQVAVGANTTIQDVLDDLTGDLQTRVTALISPIGLATGDPKADLLPKLLAVADGDTITVTYSDADPVGTRTDTATADLTPPTLVLISPEDGSFTNNATPTFSVEASDSVAGLSDPVNVDLEIPDGSVITTAKSPIINGFRLTFTQTTALAEQTLSWSVDATDDVGNNVADPTGTTADPFIAGSSDDPFTVTIDTTVPDMVAAVTGTGIVSGVETTGVDTAIRVEYDGGIDGTTVVKGDYDVVSSSEPIDAQPPATLVKTDAVNGVTSQITYDLTEAPLDLDDDNKFADDVSVTVDVTETPPETPNGTIVDFTADFSPKDVDGDGDIEDDVTATVDDAAVEVVSVTAAVVKLDVDPATAGNQGPATGTTVVISYTADITLFAEPAVVNVDDVKILQADADALDTGDVLNVTYTFDSSRFVYLTVSAQASGAACTVNQVDAVGDLAGNATLTDSIACTDGLDPSFTVTTTASPDVIGLVGDGQTVTINITSDETLAGLPTVTVGGFTATVTQLTSTTFEAEVIAGTNINASGLFDVVVAGSDAAGNAGSATHPLEFDLVVPGVTFDPVDEGTAFRSLADIARVTATYNDADEYFGDETDTVTVTSATLDGEDVTLFTNDNIVWSLGGVLDLGAHILVVTAEDAAGNSRTDTLDFTVDEPPDVDITLDPGWNLISVPGGIADPSVSNVFAGTNVSKVFTWDPVRFWTAAILNPDTGAFEGSLISISASNGYWVFTDRFETLTVTLAKRGPTTVIPNYNLTAGFNLIGFTAIAADTVAPISDSRLDESVDTDTYLASLGDTWTNLVGFDPATGFEVQTPGGPGTMDMGKGYWVFLSEAGTLIPGSEGN